MSHRYLPGRPCPFGCRATGFISSMVHLVSNTIWKLELFHASYTCQTFCPLVISVCESSGVLSILFETLAAWVYLLYQSGRWIPLKRHGCYDSEGQVRTLLDLFGMPWYLKQSHPITWMAAYVATIKPPKAIKNNRSCGNNVVGAFVVCRWWWASYFHIDPRMLASLKVLYLHILKDVEGYTKLTAQIGFSFYVWIPR